MARVVVVVVVVEQVANAVSMAVVVAPGGGAGAIVSAIDLQLLKELEAGEVVVFVVEDGASFCHIFEP